MPLSPDLHRLHPTRRAVAALDAVAGAGLAAGGITLAPENLPATMPIGSSQFYARNISALLLQLVKDGALDLSPEDEIAGPVTITHGGEIRSDAVKKLLAPAESKA